MHTSMRQRPLRLRTATQAFCATPAKYSISPWPPLCLMPTVAPLDSAHHPQPILHLLHITNIRLGPCHRHLCPRTSHAPIRANIVTIWTPFHRQVHSPPHVTPRTTSSPLVHLASPVRHEYTSRTVSSSPTSSYPARADSRENGEDISVHLTPSTQPANCDLHCLVSPFPTDPAISAPHYCTSSITVALSILSKPAPVVSY